MNGWGVGHYPGPSFLSRSLSREHTMPSHVKVGTPIPVSTVSWQDILIGDVFSLLSDPHPSRVFRCINQAHFANSEYLAMRMSNGEILPLRSVIKNYEQQEYYIFNVEIRRVP